MTGPERLEAGPPPHPRRPRWALAVLVAAVLSTLLVARVDALPGAVQALVPGRAPAPASTPSDPAATPPRPDVPARAWTGDISAGAGTLYVTVGRSILTVDARTGLVTDTGESTAGYDVRLTAVPGGVLVWYPDRRPSALLSRRGDGGRPLTGALVGANRFLPASGGVWATRVDARQPNLPASWRLVDETGRVRRTVDVPGRAVSDGAGGLLALRDGTVRRVDPRTHGADPGAVVATGPDGFLVQRCTGGTCTTVLRDRSGRRTVLAAPVAGSAVDGALSPGNRFVLLSQLVWDSPVLQVRPLGSARPVRTFQGAGGGAVWLDERWVAFVGRTGLVLYDAVDDVVVDTALGEVARLAWQPY